MSVWKLRDGYFSCAGAYKLDTGEETIILDVDENGLFNIEGEPPYWVGIFARILLPKKRRSLFNILSS